jgi:hypothetical protein
VESCFSHLLNHLGFPIRLVVEDISTTVLIDFGLGGFASESNDKLGLLSISYPELTFPSKNIPFTRKAESIYHLH